eukprot:scaffold5966_cov118-Cylindrotheca_fusiformis.AAC.15
MKFLARICFLTALTQTGHCLAPNQPSTVGLTTTTPMKYQVTGTEFKSAPYTLDENEVGEYVENMSYAWEEEDETIMGLVETEENEEYYETYEEDEGQTTEYADGDSMYPTFDQLKEWTMEYIELIDLAGGGMTRVSVGMQHTMHEAFVFTSPKIGPIGKADFVKLMEYYNDNGLDLASAVPDLSVSYEGWHQDPDDPWRIWTMARYSGTHLGTVSIPNSRIKLCPPNHNEHPVEFTTGPQVESFLWTPDGKLLWQTMGYVGDEYTGSNKGFGGLDGLMRRCRFETSSIGSLSFKERKYPKQYLPIADCRNGGMNEKHTIGMFKNSVVRIGQEP